MMIIMIGVKGEKKRSQLSDRRKRFLYFEVLRSKYLIGGKSLADQTGDVIRGDDATYGKKLKN